MKNDISIEIIASGSTGNATLINNDILLDCGVPFKKIKPYYKNIKLVFISHVHGDHFNKTTIKKLAEERPTLRFAIGDYLVKDLVDCGVSKKNIDIIKNDKIYDYNLFKISPFVLYHDSPNMGIKIKIGTKKLIYATDTNRIDHIDAKNYDFYFIEGNYESEEELEQRKMAKLLKGEYYYEDRVKETHLSKVQATEWLMKNMGENSKYIFMHEHKSKGEN